VLKVLSFTGNSVSELDIKHLKVDFNVIYTLYLKQLVTDVKSSIRSNPAWFISPKSLQILQYSSGKKSFAEQNGLN